MINEILVKKYKLFYDNSGIKALMLLNDSLNKAIKEVKKEQDRQEKELNELILRLWYKRLVQLKYINLKQEFHFISW